MHFTRCKFALKMSALEWGTDRRACSDWNWQFHCCSFPKTQWGLVVKRVEPLARGQTGHSGAKPRAGGGDGAGDTDRRKPRRRSCQERSVKVGGTGRAAFELLFTEPSNSDSCSSGRTRHLPHLTGYMFLLHTSTHVSRCIMLTSLL